MGKQYVSFLLQWWGLDGGGQRIQIERIQTGERTRVRSWTSALAWLTGHVTNPGSTPQRLRPLDDSTQDAGETNVDQPE